MRGDDYLEDLYADKNKPKNPWPLFFIVMVVLLLVYAYAP